MVPVFTDLKNVWNVIRKNKKCVTAEVTEQADCLALTNATLFWRQDRDLDQLVEQNSKYAGLVWKERSLVEKCRPLNYRSWISPYIAQLFPPLDLRG